MRQFNHLGQNQIAMKKLFCQILGLLLISGGIYFAPLKPTFAADNSTRQLLQELDLSKNDVSVYKKIFTALRQQNFKEVTRLEKKLDNKLLEGHILAEKYLSKRYKSTYTELSDWLKQYSDLPQATRINRLAQRKNPDKTALKTTTLPTTFSVYRWQMKDFSHLSKANQQFLRTKLKDFRRAISQGKTKRARLVLENKSVKQLLPPKYYSQLANILATKYLTDNYNRLALEWGRISAKKNNNASAHWTAGLAAWRLKEYKTAASEFTKVSTASKDDDWISSAGDYWAARAYGKQNNSNKRKHWLQQAARYPYTFYGILAAHKLGQTPQYNWDKISYFNDFQNHSPDWNTLLANPGIRRGIALMFAQQEELARQEINLNQAQLSEAQTEMLLFLAVHRQMHSIAMSLSQALSDSTQNRSYDHANYPLPQWEPHHGWKIEPALVWALSRQESSFRPYVSSPAGACGLMQLLPSTAAYVSGNKTLKRNKSRLFSAEYNLELGQSYVEYLLSKPFINGNLLYMLTAYNAGPGNLAKWQKEVKYGNDPLLYMEVIPAKETRIYIERVMTNYWIYQIRLKKPTSTLEQLSQDHWPTLSAE